VQMITHPGESKRIVKASLTFFGYLLAPAKKAAKEKEC
jgi:hypothetical protein